MKTVMMIVVASLILTSSFFVLTDEMLTRVRAQMQQFDNNEEREH